MTVNTKQQSETNNLMHNIELFVLPQFSQPWTAIPTVRNDFIISLSDDHLHRITVTEIEPEKYGIYLQKPGTPLTSSLVSGTKQAITKITAILNALT
jgi:hypothetical protein